MPELSYLYVHKNHCLCKYVAAHPLPPFIYAVDHIAPVPDDAEAKDVVFKMKPVDENEEGDPGINYEL